MRLFVIAAFLNQSSWFKNAAITNSRILKSIFTLILKRATYAFILSFFLALHVFSLFLLWCSSLLLRVSLCSLTIVSSFRFALFLLHQWFINFFRFTYLFVFLHWRRVLWCFIFSFVYALVLFSFSMSLHCLFCAIESSFRVLFLLHHWFIYIFLFLLSICFLVLTKVTIASLPVVWVIAMLYLLRCCCCHRYCCLRV